MLATKERRCTVFLPNAKFYYGASTPLLRDGFAVSSCRGLAQDTGVGWVHSYRDENLRVVFCRHRLCTWEGRARSLGEATGPRLNPRTCLLWGPGLTAAFPSSGFGRGTVAYRVLGVTIGYLDFETDDTRVPASNLGKPLTKLSSQACQRSASLIPWNCQGSAKPIYLLQTLRFFCSISVVWHSLFDDDDERRRGT